MRKTACARKATDKCYQVAYKCLFDDYVQYFRSGDADTISQSPIWAAMQTNFRSGRKASPDKPALHCRYQIR